MDTHDENSEERQHNRSEFRFSALKKMNPIQLMNFIRELEDQIRGLKVELELARIRSEEKIRELQLKIEQLSVQSKAESLSQYNFTWTGIEKIVYILREEKRAMKASQIKSEFSILEPDRLLIWGKQLSAIEKYIQRGVKSGRLIKILFPNCHCFYGLPEWLDEKGNLIGSYRPK